MLKLRAALTFAFAVGFVTYLGPATGPVLAVESGQAKSNDRWLEPKDERLTKKVTVSAEREKISDVLADLSKQTSVTLNAGYNKSDWQVRDRRVIIFAKDIPAAGLMNSIARVTKLTWKREGSGDTASYRLQMDKRTLSDAEKKRLQEEKYLDDRRKATLDMLMDAADATPEQIAEMRRTNPIMADYASNGMARGIAGMFRSIPGFAEAFASGESVGFNLSELPPDTQAVCGGFLDAIKRYAASAGVTLNYGTNSIMRINDELTGYRELDVGSIIYGSPDDPDRTDITDPESALGRAKTKEMLEEASGVDPNSEQAKQTQAEVLKAIRNGDPDLGEPAPDHPDEPALHDKTTLDPKGKLLSDVLSALSEAGRVAVVSDSFGKQPGFLRVRRKDAEMKDVLEAIGQEFGTNWDKKGSIVEFRNHYWYKKRVALIPDDVLDEWRKSVRATNTLDIEPLSQIASLNLEQFNINVDGDDLLGSTGLKSAVIFNQDILRLYASLNPRQRRMMFSKTGLALSDITPTQWPMAQDMILRRNSVLLEDPNVRVAFVGMAAEKGKQTKYTITLSAEGTPTRASVWTILTPKYETQRKQ